MSRELAARATASRLATFRARPDPRSRRSPRRSARTIGGLQFILRELSAARAVSSDAARTVSSAPHLVGLRLQRRRCIGDGVHADRGRLLELTRHLLQVLAPVRLGLRSKSIRTRSRRCRSRKRSANRSISASSRSTSLRGTRLLPDDESSSARAQRGDGVAAIDDRAGNRAADPIGEDDGQRRHHGPRTSPARPTRRPPNHGQGVPPHPAIGPRASRGTAAAPQRPAVPRSSDDACNLTSAAPPAIPTLSPRVRHPTTIASLRTAIRTRRLMGSLGKP